MADFTIKTNNVPRPLLSWYELTKKEQKEFDYIDKPEDDGHDRFVRYKGAVYDMHDMMAVRGLCADSPLNKWEAYVGDSYFSGSVFRYAGEFSDMVVCGYYVC